MRRIRVPRTARYAVLGDPGTAWEVWFVVHGYRQLAERFILRFRELPGLESGERAVVAPEALSRFYIEREAGVHGPDARVGASWMTRADREHEIRDYVEYLDRVSMVVLGSEGAEGSGGSHGSPVTAAPAAAGHGGVRLVVLGFSQGAETASRWVTYGRIRPAELVVWSGGLAEDLDPGRAAESLGRLGLTFVVGDADAWALQRSEESLSRTREWGVAAERVEYAGGHAIEAGVLARRWPRQHDPRV